MNPQAGIFGCNTYSYIRTRSAGDCLARLADLGFRDFELMVYPGHLWNGDAEGLRHLRRVIDDHGLRILTLNMPNIDINITAASAEMRQYSLAMLEDVIALAGELRAPGIVIGPGKANPLFPADDEELIGHMFDALDRLCPQAKAAGTALWVENIPFAFLPAIDGLNRALDRYGNDDVGIVYDVANAHFIGEDIGTGLARCGKRLRLVHLSDTGQQHYRHDPVGKGSVPFGELPALLFAAGYTRQPVIEIISRNADRDILESVDLLAGMGFADARAAKRKHN